MSARDDREPGRAPRNLPRVGYLATLVCVVALGFAACGGDDGSDASGGATGAQGEAPSGSRAAFDDRLRREVLIRQQRLTPSEADCAIAKLEREITGEQVAESEAAGEFPPEVTREAFAAGISCAGR